MSTPSRSLRTSHSKSVKSDWGAWSALPVTHRRKRMRTVSNPESALNHVSPVDSMSVSVSMPVCSMNTVTENVSQDVDMEVVQQRKKRKRVNENGVMETVEKWENMEVEVVDLEKFKEVVLTRDVWGWIKVMEM